MPSAIMTATASELSPLSMEAESIPLPVGKSPLELTLRLRRYGRGEDPSALLLHGANTSSDTFLLPEGGLVRFLLQQGWQVWLLDWRGSPYVIERLPVPPPWPGGSALEEIRHYTVDEVAREDIPAALGAIRHRIGPRAHLSVLGHCVGGGSLSIAIAKGHLEPFAVKKVVLSTLGLFYEVPWSGWPKAEDFLLERVLGNNPDCGAISPKRSRPNPRDWPWPLDMERAYRRWPRAWLPKGHFPGAQMLRRLTFMIGEPYALERLHRSLRGGEVDPVFGPLHMGLYLHLGQMVRRGYAAAFDAPDVIDRTRLSSACRAAPIPQSYLDPAHFRHLQTTLISAGENQVWHRDALDLMYEWLRNNRAPSVKRVFPHCDIQELLWGEHSKETVYPAIVQGL
jgi:pimeloyl-ACP methyl ester carboxylesterase